VSVEISKQQVVEQLRTLGVGTGDVLLVHTSFRAVRPIEGGPEGLIRALQESVGPAGTIVTPAWTGSDEEVFDSKTTRAAEMLGVVPDMFWRMPGVRRSDHPFAFAAAGPHAAHVTGDPFVVPPYSPHSPLARVHELDGRVLLLGVGHDANTTVHLAEILAGVPYRVPKHITIEFGRRRMRIDYLENDHCCQRFALLDDWLRDRGLQSEGQVGHAHARLMRARDVVSVVCEKLAEDPVLFLHPPDARCEECDDARRSVRYN
jgi:aminoglycoside N3'-acetyltransferase